MSTHVLAHQAGAGAAWPAGLQLKSQAEAQQIHKDLAKQKQKADGMNVGQQPIGVVAPDETVLQLQAMSIEGKSLTPLGNVSCLLSPAVPQARTNASWLLSNVHDVVAWS